MTLGFAVPLARVLRVLLALLAAASIAGCATTGSGAQSLNGTGTILAIHESQQSSTAGSVAGAIGGAVLGSWLGSYIGGGVGRTVAMTAAGVGGSMAGSAAGAKVAANTVFDVTIRFDDGIDRTIRVREVPDARPGARVRVTNNQIAPI
jgi:outer membrane lipoprotein SlyB